jgi:hypothetical protein
VTGVLAISSDDYHADQVADQPTLSASIAHLLCTASPLHAWAAHPRLNPDFKREEKQHYDVGTAAHAILLEGMAAVEVVDAPDWRTSVAREARDVARENGRIPLLARTLAEVEAMVDAVREQLAVHNADPPLFTDGKAEQTLVWEEDSVACRARVDWLRDDWRALDDLKTTSRSANPDAYSRNLFGVGGDVQAAFYVRGMERVFSVTPEFRWCVVESSPPYALSVVAPGPDVLALGTAKVDRAIALWRRCLGQDEWPGYPLDVCYAEMPAWEETRWMERETREAA